MCLFQTDWLVFKWNTLDQSNVSDFGQSDVLGLGSKCISTHFNFLLVFFVLNYNFIINYNFVIIYAFVINNHKDIIKFKYSKVQYIYII